MGATYRSVVDEETGEVTATLMPGDRIVRGTSIEYLDQFTEWKIEHFYKGNLSEIRLWMRELSPYEKAVLFTVSPYVGYEDCCLKQSNGDALTFGDIVSFSGLSKSTVSEVLNSLREKDILCKNENSREKQYFMNPWLFCKGNRINKVLRTMFRNYKIKVCDGMKWKDLRD